MWHAPALTITAQAFLLIVLTDRGVDAWARLAILAAGVLAIVAALLSLLRLRAREVQYSRVIAHFFDAAGLPDPRVPDELPQKKYDGPTNELDQRLQRWSRQWHAPVYLMWASALVLFLVADVVAFAFTI